MGTGILQPTHLIFLLLLALLLFGAKRLPEIGRSLGVGMREFKDSVSGMTNDSSETKVETRSELPPPAPVPAAAPPAAPPAQEAPVVTAEPEHETEAVS